jgi:hypothetical protein
MEKDLVGLHTLSGINYEGTRQAKRVGTGVSAKGTAHTVVAQHQGREYDSGSLVYF